MRDWLSRSLSCSLVVFVVSVAMAADSPDGSFDLRGKVVDDAGKPVTDANVAVIYKSWPNNHYRQRSLVAQTNEQGEFSLKDLYERGERTAFHVSIVKRGHAIESTYVLNSEGNELDPFEFELSSSQPLIVQLVDTSGNPIANSAVAPRSRKTIDGEEHRLFHLSLRSVAVKTDSEGRVDLSYFRTGDQADAEVFVDGEGTKATFTVEEDLRRIAVDLKRPLDLTGSVHSKSGQALADSTVLVIFKSWPNNRYQQTPLVTKTDDRGQFRFPGLYKEGERTAFLVTAIANGFAMESRYLVNQDGTKRDFPFRLAEAEELVLQLVDQQGRPVAGASVFPKRRETASGDGYTVYSQSGPSIARRTDADGKLALHLFRAGDTVDLAVSRPGLDPSTVTLTVGRGDRQVIEVNVDGNVKSDQRWEPEPRQATAAQTAWIRKSAIPLASIDPANDDFSDLEPLKDLIGDARIVQLGEQSHGDGTCFETKTRLVKFLHQEMGFDVLAFESGLFDCRKAWQAFVAGRPASEAASQGIFSIWTGSRQVQPLLQYLASNASSNRPLELCGFDSQFTARGSREHLVKDLRRLISELQITVSSEGSLEEAYVQLGRLVNDPRDRPGDHQTLTDVLEELSDALAAKRGVDAQKAREINFWQQALKSIRAHAKATWTPGDSSINARDRQMANNLAWLANNEYKDRKIIVWAASFHIMRNPSEIEVPSGVVSYDDVVPMGHHLAEEFGDALFTIGFTAYDGVAGAYFRPQHAIGRAPDGTFEAICNAAELTNAIIPFRNLAGGGEWLNEKQLSRPLGYAWMRARWPRHFDAMVYNRTMQPSSR